MTSKRKKILKVTKKEKSRRDSAVRGDFRSAAQRWLAQKGITFHQTPGLDTLLFEVSKHPDAPDIMRSNQGKVVRCAEFVLFFSGEHALHHDDAQHVAGSYERQMPPRAPRREIPDISKPTIIITPALSSKPIRRAKPRTPTVRTAAPGASFYESREWHALRYRALTKYGAVCMCCGATRKEGAIIQVDHIKPRSLYPDLELEFTNLQVLCKPCNMGKSNVDTTDWRGELRYK